MTKENYLQTLNNCVENIKKLPPNEVNYYLLLLINSIEFHHSEVPEEFANELHNFTALLEQLMQMDFTDDTQVKDKLNGLVSSYQQLYKISKLSRLSVKIGYSLLNIAGAILAFFTGIMSGLIGGSVGFCRGVINLSNPFTYAGYGLVTGLFLGAAIGFRIPKKLFKNELSRQIKVCLDGIAACVKEIEKQREKTFEAYKKEVKDDLILKKYFKDEAEFNEFLTSEQTFDVCTLDARFLSPTLEGYVGQHAFIKIAINKDEEKTLLIELSPSPSSLKRPRQQVESRICVSGAKIIEMLALHEMLKQIHTGSIKYALTIMKPGENDCFTYVNKILVGTQQKPTSVCRFSGKESWVCRRAVRFFVDKLTPFKDELKLNLKPILS